MSLYNDVFVSYRIQTNVSTNINFQEQAIVCASYITDAINSLLSLMKKSNKIMRIGTVSTRKQLGRHLNIKKKSYLYRNYQYEYKMVS